MWNVLISSDRIPAAPLHPDVVIACFLALLVLCGAVACTDVTRRRIPNALSLAVAFLAVPYWLGWAGAWGLLALLLHVLPIGLLAIPLVLLFWLRLFGGGDVKLILAMALWVPPQDLPAFCMAVALAGGLLGGGMQVLHLVFWRVKTDSVPYGLAIAAGAIAVLGPAIRLALAASCGIAR
ncbi:prepilin peptidase CpaA [Novosphingobium sp. PhB165]|uniref:prepilin peptidase n=1 Tax=Novosphingobium sp. PhB165 TaxID=2485105 RepID=UPI00104CA162|nr:A24 family peptidase [Novosphingobium sp. PhB165]TCM15385.1 prepilin peptidase CpaA [Novosphingobium sp. PhB165]